ncbi:MAG TPA: hypothetical protein VFF48_10870, partial [Brevundimonas sp.]|nr:hypothetical protein [Brevundimonas sp.]
QVMRALGALLTGDWSTMWNALGSAVAAMTHGVLEAFRTLFPGVLGNIKRMIDGVKAEMIDRLFGVLDGVIRKVRGVGEAFFKLYDAVVGHSYVPDMVKGIAEWMAKLDAGMVAPAIRATDRTRAAFADLRGDIAAIMEGLLTDQERAARDLAAKTARIREAVRNGMSPVTGAQMEAGVAGQGLQAPERMSPLQPLTAAADLKEVLGLDRIKERIQGMREDFAIAMADGMEAALRGDWTSVLRMLFGDTLRSAMEGLGGQLFDWLGKGSAGGASGGFSGIVSRLFGAFTSGLPKFASGGTCVATTHGGIG